MPLVHIAFPAGEDVLDRVLDRNNMVILLLVHDIEKSSHRRCLPGSGRPRNEDNPLPVFRKVSQDLRQVKPLKGGNLIGNNPEDGIDTLALLEGTRPVAAMISYITEIEVILLLEGFPLEIIEDLVDLRGGIFRCCLLYTSPSPRD